MTLAHEVMAHGPWIEHLLHRKVPEDLWSLTYSQVAQRVGWVKAWLDARTDGGGVNG